MKYYLEMFTRSLDFRGRSGVREYWVATLYNIIFGFCAEMLALPFIADLNAFFIVANSLASLYGVITFIPSLALTFRRLHDTNHSGWFIFVSILPLFGWFLLIFVLCQPSSFKVDPMFDDFQNHTDKTYNETYNNQSATKDENELENVDEIKINSEDTEQDFVTENSNLNTKNDYIENKKDTMLNDDEPIKIDESKISISNVPKKTRVEQIKECQELLNSGEITKEEYDRRVLHILSK